MQLIYSKNNIKMQFDSVGGGARRAGVNIQEIKQKELTYKIRLSRIASIQTVYAIDVKGKASDSTSSMLFSNSSLTCGSISDFCENTLYYFRTVFFDEINYTSFKDRKIDGVFLFDLVDFTVKNLPLIDSIIQNFLKQDWTVARLDYVIRAILRVSTAETIQRVIKKVKKYKDKEALGEEYKESNIRINIAIITSEYTNIAGLFYNEQITGFANSVLDKIVNHIILNHDKILLQIK